MKSHRLLIVLALAVGGISAGLVSTAPVSAVTTSIFFEDFNSMTAGSTGTQAHTGLRVGAWFSLAGWTYSGTNAIHNVDRTGSGDFAASFYNNNEIVTTAAVVPNISGTTYLVTYEAGPSVWAAASQSSNASDGLNIILEKSNGSVFKTIRAISNPWNATATAQTLTSRSFMYVGDGSGSLKIRINNFNGSADRFGGAIDNLRISSVSEGCPSVNSTTGNDTVVKITTVGSCNWAVPSGVTDVRVLVVGGGGGGSADVGGGGGGGQVVDSSISVSGTLSVVVGAGGEAGYNRVGNASGSGRAGGTSSVVVGATTRAAKGGSGATGRSGANNLNADGTSNSTGYTGGGGAYADSSQTATGSTGTGGAGVKGGDGSGAGGGGGGGAGGAGSAASSGISTGGVGLSTSITGTTEFFGGGGGGGGYAIAPGVGGNGGGGSGSVSNGPDGTNGTNGLGGGGGGSGSNGAATGRGGAGGSGVVIIRYSNLTAPINSVVPVVSGTARSGQTLTATAGTWSGDPTPTYTYQWKSSSTVGGSYTNISGATSSTYVLTNDEVGKYVKVAVTATNSVSGATELSAATSVISAIPTTTTTAAPVVEIVVSAPVTTVAVGQGSIATIAPSTVTIPTVTVKPSVVSTVAPRSLATTTTVVVPVTPPGPVVPPAPKIEAVAAGEVGVKVGDKTEKATVERVNNQYVVSVGALKATFAPMSTSGSGASLDNDGNIRLLGGSKIKITMNGFKPGSILEAWLFSTPALLGTAKVGTDGSVTGTFTIPDNADDGAHRIALVAQTKDGKPTTFTVGVMVGEWDGGPNVTLWLIVLPIVLAVGGALAIPATRRRRKSLA